MDETKQHQGSDGLPSNTTGNGSQPPPVLKKPDDQPPPNQAAPRKATGPRAVREKKRSRSNALKHGLLSKFVLLIGESEDEYRSLSFGLQDYYQPQGKLESFLVERLTILLWRYRRFIHAENAEISREIFLVETEMRMQQADEALQLSRRAMVSDGLVTHHDNLFVIKEILETWKTLRQLITTGKFNDSILFFINKLYGVNQYGKTPDLFRLAFETHFEVVKLGNTQVDQSKVSELKEGVISMIDGEIERYSALHEFRENIMKEKVFFKKRAAVIPSGGASDRLLRYETQLSREIDRTVNQLERLQGMRKGQPLPPQLDVKIS
jgi:hypothetical protein